MAKNFLIIALWAIIQSIFHFKIIKMNDKKDMYFFYLFNYNVPDGFGRTTDSGIGTEK